MLRTATFCAAISIAASPMLAQEAGDVSLGIGVSTFGGNLEAGYAINDQFRLRGAVIGGLSYAELETSDTGEVYEINGDVGGLAVLADYYPTRTGWRVSGGLFLSNTDFASRTEASGLDPIIIDGTSYTSGSVTGSARFNNEVAPILTTGYDLRFGNNWTLSSEVGAVITGGVDLTVEAGGAIPQSQIDSDPSYQQSRDDADALKVYPYLGVSLALKF